MNDQPSSNPRLRLTLLPFFSIVGTSAAVYLSKHYYDLRVGTASFKSLCNINSTMNCDAVTASRFAEIVPGLPLSSIVAGWFLALFILGLIARVSDFRREAVLVSAIMTGFASLYSIALLVVMTVVLKKFCLFCLVIDVATFGLFGVTLSLLAQSKGTSVFAGIRMPRLQSNALLVLGCVVIMVVVLRPSAENLAKETKAEIDYALNQISERAPVVVNTPPGASVLGNPSAPITIHEFSDFQCPHCRRGALMMSQLLARYDGRIKVVYMPFPLDQACNRMITRPMHPYSCQLARSTFCAEKSGKFKAVYERIFEDQETLKADSAKKIALEHGITDVACFDSEPAKQFLSQSIEEGLRLKVEATPTFFINGKKVDVPLPIEGWDRLITSAQ